MSSLKLTVLSGLLNSAQELRDGERWWKELSALSTLNMDVKNRNAAKRNAEMRRLEWQGECTGLDNDSGVPAVVREIVKSSLATTLDAGDASELDRTNYKVVYICSGPSARVTIKEPAKDVAARLLYNFGVSDVYNLDRPPINSTADDYRAYSEVVDLSSIVDHREIYMSANSMLSLRCGVIADYDISVAQPAPKTKPFTPSLQKPTGVGGPFMRIPKPRITLLVDIVDLDGQVTENLAKARPMIGKLGKLVAASDDHLTKSEAKQVDRQLGL